MFLLPRNLRSNWCRDRLLWSRMIKVLFSGLLWTKENICFQYFLSQSDCRLKDKVKTTKRLNVVCSVNIVTYCACLFFLFLCLSVSFFVFTFNSCCCHTTWSQILKHVRGFVFAAIGDKSPQHCLHLASFLIWKNAMIIHCRWWALCDTPKNRKTLYMYLDHFSFNFSIYKMSFACTIELDKLLIKNKALIFF